MPHRQPLSRVPARRVFRLRRSETHPQLSGRVVQVLEQQRRNCENVSGLLHRATQMRHRERHARGSSASGRDVDAEFGSEIVGELSLGSLGHATLPPRRFAMGHRDVTTTLLAEAAVDLPHDLAQ